MAKKMSRIHKASALVPMAILVGAWGIAAGNSGLASAIGGHSASMPEVPASALEQPAAQRTIQGLDPQAGAAGTISTLSTNGIPASALYAYRHAESLLTEADPGCHLPWNLIAAVGRVETNHGRINGSALTADGVATPSLYGDPGRTVADTDNGELDNDVHGDRLVGPFQFLPAVWTGSAVDADNDGSLNPQDVDDAATTAGVFLCSGHGDLNSDADTRAAVQRLNSDPDYVDLVLKISAAYANGQYSQTPDGYTTSTILTSQSYDQTLTPSERKKARDKERDEDDDEDNSSSNSGGSTGGGTSTGGNSGNNGGNNGGGSNGGGGNNGGGDDDGGGDDNGGGSSNNPLGDTLKKTTDGLNKTLKDTTDGLNKTLKDTTDGLNKTLKGTTDGLDKTLKGLLGSKDK